MQMRLCSRSAAAEAETVASEGGAEVKEAAMAAAAKAVARVEEATVGRAEAETGEAETVAAETGGGGEVARAAVEVAASQAGLVVGWATCS